jgi:hypothetical protein
MIESEIIFISNFILIILKNFKTIINASPQKLSSKANIPYKTSIKIWRI